MMMTPPGYSALLPPAAPATAPAAAQEVWPVHLEDIMKRKLSRPEFRLDSDYSRAMQKNSHEVGKGGKASESSELSSS